MTNTRLVSYTNPPETLQTEHFSLKNRISLDKIRITHFIYTALEPISLLLLLEILFFFLFLFTSNTSLLFVIFLRFFNFYCIFYPKNTPVLTILTVYRPAFRGYKTPA